MKILLILALCSTAFGQVYNDSQTNHLDSHRDVTFTGRGGKNFGNAAGAVDAVWTTDGLNYWTMVCMRRGICGYLTGTTQKWATGDNGWLRTNAFYWVGGSPDASGEGHWGNSHEPRGDAGVLFFEGCGGSKAGSDDASHRPAAADLR